MNKKIIQKVFAPHEKIPAEVICPNQTHSTKVVEIIAGTEDLTQCDGLWTRDPQFVLGVRTADCASICFWDTEKHGIIHAGWRGLVGGIVENMQSIFSHSQTTIFVGPLLPIFEIQKDFCYEQIEQKFNTKFFIEKKGKIYFEFQKALGSVLPSHTMWDGRSTYDTDDLASWRRDKTSQRNTTVIYTKGENS